MKLITQADKIPSLKIMCDECKKEVTLVLQISDSGSEVVWLCKSCLKEALSLFPQESAKEKLGARMGWVSVKERLPDQIGNYLVYGNNRTSVYMGWAFFNSDKRWVAPQLFYGGVTHWMSLPEPPHFPQESAKEST